jgi:hypothetical protein
MAGPRHRKYGEGSVNTNHRSGFRCLDRRNLGAICFPGLILLHILIVHSYSTILKYQNTYPPPQQTLLVRMTAYFQ